MPRLLAIALLAALSACTGVSDLTQRERELRVDIVRNALILNLRAWGVEPGKIVPEKHRAKVQAGCTTILAAAALRPTERALYLAGIVSRVCGAVLDLETRQPLAKPRPVPWPAPAAKRVPDAE